LPRIGGAPQSEGTIDIARSIAGRNAGRGKRRESSRNENQRGELGDESAHETLKIITPNNA
jgi:hypothetical protein